MKFGLLKYLLFTLAAVFLQLSQSNADGPRTIIVMDGSGSMWGRIDGKTKLEIAKATVGEVLGKIPATQELGLLAYGHRSKGKCDDIELIVPPAKGTSQSIMSAVNQMRFLGKTPLTEAVRRAAEALRFTEEEATVVLVTDGLETCNADPCALGRELERTGLNFTAHVIGFGLTKEEGAQVACLAENTGGKYFEASNANGLAEALTTAVTTAAPPPKAPPAVIKQTAVLRAPGTAPGGSLLKVGFDGPKGGLDYIIVLDGKGENVSEIAVGGQDTVLLRVPFALSDYELAYNSEESGIIARQPLKVVKAEVALDTPDTSPAGSTLEIKWVGPQAEYDYIQLLEKNGDRFSEILVGSDNPTSLLMPFKTGEFELVYNFRSKDIIYRRPIVLTPTEVAIFGPDKAQVGSSVEIRWVGPESFYDNIQLFSEDGSERFEYQYVKDRDVVSFTMPDKPGAYKFVYRFNDAEDIASKTITVGP